MTMMQLPNKCALLMAISLKVISAAWRGRWPRGIAQSEQTDRKSS